MKRITMSFLFAGALALSLAPAPVNAQVAKFRAELKREVTDLQGVSNNVAGTAGSVKKTAADVEAAAAKAKATAARVEGVANVSSKGLGLLASKIRFNSSETEEYVVQHFIEKALHDQGVTVVNDDGPAVCNFRVYIGIDDADDDDDGILDATDTDHFGDMDDFSDSAASDLADSQLIEVDLDKEDPDSTAGLPDTVKEQGIFIVLVADNPDQVVVFHLDADSFSDSGGGGATASSGETFAAHAPSRRAVGKGWGEAFSAVASFGKQVMAQAAPAKDKGVSLISSWLSALKKH